MIESFRKYRKSTLGFVIIGFTGLLMIGFGVDFSQGGGQVAPVVINGEEVPPVEIARKYQQLVAQAQQQLGENFEKFKSYFNFEEQALQAVIQTRLLSDFTSQAQLSASPELLKAEIAEAPFFDKGFNKAAYKNFLNQIGMSAAQLEAEAARAVVTTQLQELLSDVSISSEKELYNQFVRDNTKYEFNYVSVSPDSLSPSFEKSDEEKLKEFYENNKEDYRKPRSVSFSYIAFEPKSYESVVEVHEEDLNAAYRQKSEQFKIPAKYKLREILIKKEGSDEPKTELEKLVTDHSDDNIAAKLKADTVLADLENGKNFIELAVEVSEHATRAVSGGNLGWKELSSLDTSFQDAVQSLDVGNYSDIIETPKGYHILYLENFEEESKRPFDDVKLELEAELKRLEAPTYARADAENKFDIFTGKNVSIVEFAKEVSKVAKSTYGFVSSAEPQSGVAPELVKSVENFAEGAKDIVDVNGVAYIVQIEKVKDSFIPELEAVKDTVKEDYLRDKSLELAKAKAESVMAKASESDLSKAASDAELEVKTASEITRASSSDPLFLSPEVRSDVFSLTVEDSLLSRVVEHNGDFHVIALKGKTPPADSEFEAQKKSLADQQRQQSQTRLTGSLIANLTSFAEIKIDPAAAKNFY